MELGSWLGGERRGFAKVMLVVRGSGVSDRELRGRFI
jgi:hypothetical protein